MLASTIGRDFSDNNRLHQSVTSRNRAIRTLNRCRKLLDRLSAIRGQNFVNYLKRKAKERVRCGNRCEPQRTFLQAAARDKAKRKKRTIIDILSVHEDLPFRVIQLTAPPKAACECFACFCVLLSRRSRRLARHPMPDGRPLRVFLQSLDHWAFPSGLFFGEPTDLYTNWAARRNAQFRRNKASS